MCVYVFLCVWYVVLCVFTYHTYRTYVRTYGTVCTVPGTWGYPQVPKTHQNKQEARRADRSHTLNFISRSSNFSNAQISQIQVGTDEQSRMTYPYVHLCSHEFTYAHSKYTRIHETSHELAKISLIFRPCKEYLGGGRCLGPRKEEIDTCQGCCCKLACLEECVSQSTCCWLGLPRGLEQVNKVIFRFQLHNFICI